MARDDPSSDDVFAVRAATPEDLRRLARWAGSALASSCLLPVATQHDGARFVWQLAPDLRAASAWVLLAPGLAGVAVMVAAWRCRRAASLAIGIVGALVAALVAASWSRAILAWDLLPEPAVLAHRPAASLAAVAFAAAGAFLAQREATRRAARGCLVVSAGSAVLHLALPVSGEAPLRALARIVPHVATHSGRGNLGAVLVLSAVLIWPAIAAAAACARFVRRAAATRPLWAVVLGYGFPVPLAPLVAPALLEPWRETTSATVLAAILVLGPMVALLPVAVVVVSTAALGADRDRGWPAARSALVTAAAITIVMTATAIAARPPRVAVDWPLRAATPEGNRLFAELIPAWNDARRDDAERLGAEAAGLARALDGNLGGSIAAFLRGSAAPDLGERRWYRLVADVNEASRAAHLPYYLDPTAVVGTAGDPTHRWYRIDTYRIERVNRSRVADRGTATLHVRALSPTRGRLPAMGLSRDLQPFAVVVLDEIESYAADLEQLASRNPPRCREAPGETSALEQTLLGCGELLAGVLRTADLRAALLDTTERHEIQHQLDAPEPPPSAWVTERLAWAPAPHRRRVERELRAYLAQMTARAPAASLTLVRLARLVALSRSGIEHDAALLALQALGEGQGSWWESFDRLRPLGEAELAQRAQHTFARLFGADPNGR